MSREPSTFSVIGGLVKRVGLKVDLFDQTARQLVKERFGVAIAALEAEGIVEFSDDDTELILKECK